MMTLTREEIIAAAFGRFGIVAGDEEIAAFADWLTQVNEKQNADLVTYEKGSIQQRTERLITDAEKAGLAVTITLRSDTVSPAMGRYSMVADFRPLRKRDAP